MKNECKISSNTILFKRHIIKIRIMAGFCASKRSISDLIKGHGYKFKIDVNASKYVNLIYFMFMRKLARAAQINALRRYLFVLK